MSDDKLTMQTDIQVKARKLRDDLHIIKNLLFGIRYSTPLKSFDPWLADEKRREENERSVERLVKRKSEIHRELEALMASCPHAQVEIGPEVTTVCPECGLCVFRPIRLSRE